MIGSSQTIAHWAAFCIAENIGERRTCSEMVRLIETMAARARSNVMLPKMEEQRGKPPVNQEPDEQTYEKSRLTSAKQKSHRSAVDRMLERLGMAPRRRNRLQQAIRIAMRWAPDCRRPNREAACKPAARRCRLRCPHHGECLCAYWSACWWRLSGSMVMPLRLIRPRV